MFMARNEFSPEEVKILNKNPYTLKATSKRIMFTLEGKKKILALYEEGKAITQILREMGYDPDMLGHHRTKGYQRHHRKTQRTSRFKVRTS